MTAQHVVKDAKATRPRICTSVCSHDVVLVYTADGWSLIPDETLAGYPEGLDAAVEQHDADEFAGDDLLDTLIIAACQDLGSAASESEEVNAA